MRNRDVRVLEHMLDYCNQLLKFTADMDFEAFNASDLHQSACALCILQIGELVINLTEEFREQHTVIPWRKVRSMRNILAHHYGSVDSAIVWSTIQQDIPQLKAFCENVLTESEDEDSQQSSEEI